MPKDLGAWLYIAKLDPKEPWRLLTDPVVLSKPEYGAMLAQALGINLDEALVAEDPAKPSWDKRNACHRQKPEG